MKKLKYVLIICLCCLLVAVPAYIIYSRTIVNKPEESMFSETGIFGTDVSGNTIGFTGEADIYAPQYYETPDNKKEPGTCNITDRKVYLNGNWVEYDGTLKTLLNAGYNYVKAETMDMEPKMVDLTFNDMTVTAILNGSVGDDIEEVPMSDIVCSNAGTSIVEGFTVGDSIDKAVEVLGNPYLETAISEDLRQKSWADTDTTVVFCCTYDTEGIITSMSIQYIDR